MLLFMHSTLRFRDASCPYPASSVLSLPLSLFWAGFGTRGYRLGLQLVCLLSILSGTLPTPRSPCTGCLSASRP